MNVKEEWKSKGFIDEPVDESLDLKQEIRRLCREKDAIILAHYYTMPEIQDIADFVGDSLALAREAAKTEAKVMVMCGVHFMAETCKLLSPEKTVLSPDLTAGCSLADSCKAEDLRKFKEEHPGYEVRQYDGGGEGADRRGGDLGQCQEGDRLHPQGHEAHLRTRLQPRKLYQLRDGQKHVAVEWWLSRP